MFLNDTSEDTGLISGPKWFHRRTFWKSMLTSESSSTALFRECKISSCTFCQQNVGVAGRHGTTYTQIPDEGLTISWIATGAAPVKLVNMWQYRKFLTENQFCLTSIQSYDRSPQSCLQYVFQVTVAAHIPVLGNQLAFMSWLAFFAAFQCLVLVSSKKNKKPSIRGNEFT